jgi:hypothetical protein
MLLIAAAIVCLGAQREAQPLDPDRLATVKAGMVKEFIRFSQWPDHPPAEQEGSHGRPLDPPPLVLTFMGDDMRLEDALSGVLSGLLVDGRRVMIRRLRYPEPRPGERAVNEETMRQFRERLHSSHLVYIAQSEWPRMRRILRELESLDVLSVSDIRGFCEAGGMLGLVVEGTRLVFEANPGEIQKTRVTVSSKVLRLARIVSTREP